MSTANPVKVRPIRAFRGDDERSKDFHVALVPVEIEGSEAAVSVLHSAEEHALQFQSIDDVLISPPVLPMDNNRVAVLTAEATGPSSFVVRSSLPLKKGTVRCFVFGG